MGRTTSEGIRGFVDDLEPKSSILDKVGDFITVNTKRHGDEREDLNGPNKENENENENEQENEQEELALDDLDRAFELVEGIDMDWMMPSHMHHSPATTATIKPRLLYSPLIHTQNAVPVTISPNLVATTTTTTTTNNSSTSTSANKITKNKSNSSSSPYLNKLRGKSGPDSAASLFELPDSVIPTPKPKSKKYPKVILPSNTKRRISSATTATTMTTTTSSGEEVVVASESPVIAPHGHGSVRPLSRRRSSGVLVDDDKRESHKHAEQARRNRLAVALHELSSLIPAEWKQQNVSAAPSKATTVEAACRYIRHLQRHGST
ncbi:pho4p [Saccharomyces arboricola H-6]|uniref:Pho4p n=1 Tax=Saccharomyces arboricola (strain H-6 / AS 2.3317 / CBS 10644) TaxID=1160507 RepID=J8Q5G0_SACAR|nr:pho4p [Saccharomyces arboricola H-6]